VSPRDLAGTVDTAERTNRRWQVLRFVGPATLVSVGYIDPGNWATDLEAGARFGLQLLWVLILANVVALFLQSSCARLGIASGRDLASTCRALYSRKANLALWVLCEIAIVACDLAEVIGSAVALNLLFGLPLFWGACIVACDVLLVLVLQHHGIRRLEAVVGVLLATVALCMLAELWIVGIPWPSVLAGVRPQLPSQSLYIALAILGATVMPHNLYLHSALVLTRAVEKKPAAQRRAIRFAVTDTAFALNGAFLINASILIVAAAVFHARGLSISDLREAHALLRPLLGPGPAQFLFALALLCAGLSATIAVTMAGQVAMQGFLRLELSPAVIRLGTRVLAIVPALAVLALAGDDATVSLLVASQVVLSFQLPFAVVPLLRFTDSRAVMGGFANGRLTRVVGWTCACVLVCANAWLVTETLSASAPWLSAAGAVAGIGGVAFLAYLATVPLRGERENDPGETRRPSLLRHPG